MEIRFLTPMFLRRYASDDLCIKFTGNTVRDLLDEVQRLYPDLHSCICDETGQLRQHINVFVGDELLSRNNLAKRLSPKDVVSVFQSVSGG